MKFPMKTSKNPDEISPRTVKWTRRTVLSARRVFQRCDVELLHLQHRREDTLRLCFVRAVYQLGQNLRHDLPRESEFILHPSALLARGVSPVAELRPVVIHLVLCLAFDLERDGFVELKMRTAIQRSER